MGKPSEGTVAIMETIELSDLQKMTDLFYEKAFQDDTLDKFIQSHSDPHGARFAKWIHQKLSGSTVWDEDRAERRRKNEGVTLANGETGLSSMTEPPLMLLHGTAPNARIGKQDV